MYTFLGILVMGVIILISILMRKANRAATKALNTKVFYKSKHNEGQKLVSETVTFSTSASQSDIMRELEVHIPTVDVPSTFKSALSEISRDEGHIGYGFGSKINDHFRAIVLFTQHEKLDCIFKFLNYTEVNGLITYQDEMNKLRNRVVAAFKAADASVKIARFKNG